MCLDDFLDISPTEFTEIYESWQEREKRREQRAYETARWTVFKTLCPPQKNEINIYDIEMFIWEPGYEPPKEVPVSTPERFEEMKKKYGQRLQTGNRNSSKR